MKVNLSINSCGKKYLGLCVFSVLPFTAGHAQRIQQQLGRGVVAAMNGSNVTVTWRRLAQEPEKATAF